MARVTLYLYGQPKRFNSKKAAKEFLMEGIMCSDGSEQERYVDCLMQLECGKTLCVDCTGIRNNKENAVSRKLYDEISRVLTEYEHPEEVGLTAEETADQVYLTLVKVQNLMANEL